MTGAAVGAEGGDEDVGRDEDQRVGARAVAVGDDQCSARGTGRSSRRAPRCRAAGSRPGASRPARRRPPSRRGRRRPRSSSARRPPPASAPSARTSAPGGPRRVGGHHERVVDGAAAWQLEERVEEEGLGEPRPLLRRQNRPGARFASSSPLTGMIAVVCSCLRSSPTSLKATGNSRGLTTRPSGCQ